MAVDEKVIIERGYVKYSDFGAVGDAIHDDWEEIVAAHDFANENGLPVYADEGYTYYVHDFTRSAVIKTDTCFTGAKFIIDDTGSLAFQYRDIPLLR